MAKIVGVDPNTLSYFVQSQPWAGARFHRGRKAGEASLDPYLSYGEYELISCSLWTPDTGVLEFSPFAFPYGGTGCMKALIEACDGEVIGEDDGTGYVSSL